MNDVTANLDPINTAFAAHFESLGNAINLDNLLEVNPLPPTAATPRKQPR